MTIFDPSQYGSAVSSLVVRNEPNELGPGTPNRSVEGRLRKLSLAELFPGRRVLHDDMAQACRAGLWLLHDFLDESHSISQEIHTTTGSYWHGIMHRREPDYENSKYWFRQVGKHPVFVPLLASVKEDQSHQPELKTLAAKSSWDPFLFVDLCQRARDNGLLANPCRALALLEWQLLFDYCYRQAVASEKCDNAR
jgi:hypothetical protein